MRSLAAATSLLLVALAAAQQQGSSSSSSSRPDHGGAARPGGGGRPPSFPERPGAPSPPTPPTTPGPGHPGGPGAGDRDGDEEFNPLEHLGANSPWFAGPNVFDIAPNAPDGCSVDQAVYIARHGSRYPDPGAYNGWLELYEKLQNATFAATGPLAFLADWQPVLDYPDQQLRQLSPGGWDELHTFGTDLRTRYPGFQAYGAPFRVWSNDYERTVDSARLFARGYLGPNATNLGTVHPILASDASVVANSLATSDSCPTYNDRSGAGYVEVWDDIYLPPIAARLQEFVSSGDLVLTANDVSSFPYLCGFETQITRRVSPFCHVFTPEEILQYEYRQDLRYWYGTGPGSFRNTSVMLPVIQGVVDLLATGPETPVEGADQANPTVGPLAVAFTHDNQINQMVSSLGIFDAQPPLQADHMNASRIYVSSRNNPMRGTVAFERLNCGGELNLRIRLNDAVYPVPGCATGPGSSCPLQQYNDEVLARKWAEAGSFEDFCELEPGSVTTDPETGGVTFFRDLTLAAVRNVVP